jgi:MFS family permease
MRARLFTDDNRKWWTLVAVSFGLFMIMLDNTVVNVALPSIRADLGISISELEWVVNAYALTFGVLLLSGGKLPTCSAGAGSSSSDWSSSPPRPSGAALQPAPAR